MKSIAVSVFMAGTLALSIAAHAKDKAAYDSARGQAQQQYKAADQACNAKSGQAKDLCQEEAKAQRDIAFAEAEARYEGTPQARAKADRERAEANYRLAKERCDALSGNEKDVCQQKAKAEHAKSKSVADANVKTADARDDVTRTRREADYKVARERCDSLSGSAKDTCIADAKTRFSM